MPITQIGRQIQTVNVSTTYSLTNPEIEQIVADATGGGFTITLYDDLQSGAYHRVVVSISSADSSGNTVTIVNAGATFSTSLDATSEAVELETTSTGLWIIAAQFSTTQAATASSKADSAGLRASTASSASVSAGLNASSATSAATSNSLIISQTASNATSQNVSQSTTISTVGSVAGSATLSGVSATASVAGSQNLSQSANVSTAQSTAAS